MARSVESLAVHRQKTLLFAIHMTPLTLPLNHFVKGRLEQNFCCLIDHAAATATGPRKEHYSLTERVSFRYFFGWCRYRLHVAAPVIEGALR